MSYRVKCAAIKPALETDVEFTYCQKDKGHTGDHYGDDTPNQRWDSIQIEMVSWASEEELRALVSNRHSEGIVST